MIEKILTQEIIIIKYGKFIFKLYFYYIFIYYNISYNIYV